MEEQKINETKEADLAKEKEKTKATELTDEKLDQVTGAGLPGLRNKFGGCY